MSYLTGSQVSDPNFLLRFALIIFSGTIAFGAVLFWKSQLLLAAEYQEMPTTHKQVKVKKQNIIKQRYSLENN
jgi:hypothetical protein